MDKGKRDKMRYREFITRSSGSEPTYRFRSTSRKFRKGSDSSEDDYDDVPTRAPVSSLPLWSRFTDALGGNTYQNAFFALMIAIIVLIAGWAFTMYGDIREMRGQLSGINEIVDDVKEKYVSNSELAKDLEYIKERIRLIEQKVLIFSGN